MNRKHKGYYIVPLGYEEGQYSEGAVVLNAYNGEFQEVGVFQKPFKYLSRDRAINIALSYICACREREKARAELIFRPSEQTQSRFQPVWAVALEKVTVYVTMDARVFDELTPLPLGD